ncbi:MAG: C40 family peptidase [Gammaproteobacteria bacterium]|nr:C40 family peptidase [Gammaproteobacteria bacterium]
MAHWSERYIGEVYIEGTGDCAAFAARVQREVFGRVIALPTARAHGMRGQSAQIELHKANYGDRIDEPQEGDAVLMIGRGRLDHIGVYCVAGEPCVLHAMRNAGRVVMHRLRDLESQGLTTEGFYRWK